jgi:hypothetical protein
MIEPQVRLTIVPVIALARSEATNAAASATSRRVGIRFVNTSAGGEAVTVGGGLVTCGAVREMEVSWPSRVVLRKRALNRREGPWLKTVVLNVVGKGMA